MTESEVEATIAHIDQLWPQAKFTAAEVTVLSEWLKRLPGVSFAQARYALDDERLNSRYKRPTLPSIRNRLSNLSPAVLAKRQTGHSPADQVAEAEWQQIESDREAAKHWLDELVDDELDEFKGGISLYAGGLLRKIGQMTREQLRNQPVALGLLRAYAKKQGA